MSLRGLAQCIGVVPSHGRLSVVRDFFGYESAAGPTAAGQTISVRTQMSLLRGRHFHVNLIRVGFEHFSTVTLVVDGRERQSDVDHLDGAVATARSILAQVGLGIGRVRPYVIADAQAAEVGVVASWITFDDQAIALTDMFTVKNDALDVFVVLQWGIVSSQTTIGRSAVNGPCDKDDACEMSGLVVSFSSMASTTGLTLAHEIGHYLGLSHVGDLSVDDLDLDDSGEVEPDEHALFPESNQNLMYPANLGTNDDVTSAQGTVMSVHCFVKTGC